MKKADNDPEFFRVYHGKIPGSLNLLKRNNS